MLWREVIVSCCLGFFGCAHTGLSPAIRTTLPSNYVERRPANSHPGLGSVLAKDGSVSVNDCYEGQVDAPDPSWSSVVASYKNSVSGKVAADFGDLVGVSGEAGASVTGTVALQGTVVFQLKDLYFLPSSGCAERADWRAQYAGRAGREDKVVVRAVTASSVEVTTSASSSGTLTANVDKLPKDIKVEASGGAAHELSTKLSGSGLFYAQQASRVTTMLTEVEQDVAVGRATSFLGSCHALVAGRGPAGTGTSGEEWSGSLECQDGKSYLMSGTVGGAVLSAKVSEGVSYGVYVAESPSKVGEVRVTLTRWVVTQK